MDSKELEYPSEKNLQRGLEDTREEDTLDDSPTEELSNPSFAQDDHNVDICVSFFHDEAEIFPP